MLIPLLAAVLVYTVIPEPAKAFFLKNIGEMDLLIISLGGILFVSQILLGWRALQWRGTGFNAGPDRWVNYLSQAAEWFPMLGLLGTVGGILQTFSAVHDKIQPHEIIRNYAPAITATGCGLYMAFVNILPAWVVITGRELISSLGGRVSAPTSGSGEMT
jgi:MotA/TolQ/ExbB proton channel family